MYIQFDWNRDYSWLYYSFSTSTNLFLWIPFFSLRYCQKKGKMKKNLKNNLKMLVAFIVIAACFVLIIVEFQYKNINIKNISLFVLIIASIYFGIVFGRRKNIEKKEETKAEEVPSSTQDIPEEFLDEEDRFKKLNDEGKIR